MSLAVWMGGAAVEFDAARRFAELDGRSSAAVYAAVCDAFDRRLVVDILSGASAGGLNGALLAGAIAKGRKLDPGFLRSKWLQIGDLDALLQPTNKPKPESLMQGDRFEQALMDTFRGLLADREADPRDAYLTTPKPPLVPADVLLDVQMTNVDGEQRCYIDEWGQPMYAHEYRAPVRFRRRDDYTAEALASAARGSASFPAAFEPHRVDGLAAQLAGFAGKTRWVIDGGLLENAPIRPAIELIPTRRAFGPVKRYICYVNADPPQARAEEDVPKQPSLRDVLGYVVNLPRNGRLVDQLNAIEAAVRDAESAGDAEGRLLELPLETLRASAEALLPTYAHKRALLSLEELLGQDPARPAGAGVARGALRRLASPAALPWIPNEVDAPTDASEWRWGLRTAQRITQLQLDLLRRALVATENQGDAEVIFDTRSDIDEAMATLEDRRQDFLSSKAVQGRIAELASPNAEIDVDAVLRALDAVVQPYRITILQLLRNTTRQLRTGIARLSDPVRAELPDIRVVFGKSEEDEEQFRAFLERALSIEVIRRAFSAEQDIVSAQSLHFAQLTPDAPTPLLTDQPLTSDLESSPEQKLTGIRLGHFAGFYRSSWRANDFMWGRLDAATRLADILVDPDRAKAVSAHGREPWRVLAERLVPVSSKGKHAPQDEDRRRLIQEALDDDGFAAPVAPEGTDQLPVHLAAALRNDLIGKKRGRGLLTRKICARAAQYEILREEAPCLVDQTREDRAAGSFTRPLQWQTNGSLFKLIEELRGYPADGTSLPAELGRDLPDEAASTLAIRTISHAGLVAVAALPNVMPLSRTLSPARIPFLAASGITARKLRQRLAVIPAATAAAWFVAGRLLDAREWYAKNVWKVSSAHKPQAPLHLLWSLSVIALWVAAAATLALLFVPAWRAFKTKDGSRRLWQALAGIAILATGGGVAIGWCIKVLGFGTTLTGWHGFAPPTWLCWLVIAITGITGAARHLPLPGFIASRAGAVIDRELSAALGITVVAGLLIYYSASHVTDGFSGGTWPIVFASLASASPLVAAWYVVGTAPFNPLAKSRIGRFVPRRFRRRKSSGDNAEGGRGGGMIRRGLRRISFWRR